MNKIRILIVDNNYRFIKSAINFLSFNKQTYPVGGAMSIDIALEMIKGYRPDIILLDQAFLNLKNTNLIEQFSKISPDSKTIITGLDDFSEYKEASLAGGAEAFIAKSNFGTSIIPLIMSISE